MTSRENVKVQLIGKEFVFACDSTEKETLLTATRYLNDQIEVVQQQGKIVGNDRIAIMVAINLASELLDLKKQESENQEVVNKIERLTNKISQEINN